jgi:signal transduction histidine kinase
MEKYRVCWWLFLLLCTGIFESVAGVPVELLIEIDGQARSAKEKLILNSEYHDIAFYFPTSHLAHANIQFRLTGLETGWQTAKYPIVRYTNLDGGKYNFEAWVTSDKIPRVRYSVPFEIKEDFWEKWWFWSFIILVIVSFISLVIYFWFLYDFRQRMRVQDIRQRIAADLHDEVGANLSSITFFVELLRKKLGKSEIEVNPLLEKISRNSRESASLISDTIWALNPEYDTFEKLIEKMKSFAAEFLAARDIALAFDPVPDYKFELSIDQRRDMFLIFKEAINNAAKHSSASLVSVSVKEEAGTLEIAVQDDGVGFDTAQTYEGNGLKNYNHRARGGETAVEIYSKPGNGTAIRIRTNLANHQN